ncbi:MAG: DUF2344 domain-containing protein [Ruminococcaceae bacterium]|nr:DUF2344 domain-containing protein [Oscillospiraceae bacterium]
MENKNIIRFKFSKKCGLKYISHLDLQRALTRIIKRSRIPVRYTQGFNPHPKMVFALPLGVGTESECELLDVYMVMDEARPNVPLYTPLEFKDAIIPNLPQGLGFIDAFYPSGSFNEITTADYEIIVDLKSEESVCDKFEKILSSPLIVFKKSKAGDRDVDIQPMIKGFSVEQNAKVLLVNLKLMAAQNNYLSPELVMTGLKNNQEINDAIDFYSITRTNINFEN